MVPAGAVAELLPAPRTAQPQGDGPNSPWFDRARARGFGASPDDPAEDGPADGEPADGEPEHGAESASEPLPGAQIVLRAFPWFG